MAFCIENKLNWLYIDINSYFVTIEQQLNPDLRYKPVVVVPLLSDSTCAIAASYEAKLLGIKTGTKIYEAKKLCPELICLEARHKVYVEYHDKIFQEIDLYLKVDHIFSIDEGACRLTGKYCLPEEAMTIARILKQTIQKNVGEYITCSIGIAPNRYLAKIASNMQKPDGLVMIRPDELPEALYKLKLNALPGIGAKTQERILKSGISSIEELCKLDAIKLKTTWGNVWGEKVWHLIRGADLPLEETKNSSIGHSQVLAPESRGVDIARNILVTLILKAANRLRSQALYTNSILLTLETMPRKSIKDRIKTEQSCDNNKLLKIVLKSWDNLIKTNNLKNIRKISVSLHGLQKKSAQLSFGDFHNQKKQEHLSKVVDLVNKKYGHNIITIGVPASIHEIKPIIAFGHIPRETGKSKSLK